MEDNTTYTYTYEDEKKKSVRSLKNYFAAVIVVFFIGAIVCGIVAGKVKAKQEVETTTESVSTTEPIVTEAPVDDTYQPGSYSVNTGSVALLFRKEHNKDTDPLLEIADKTKLEITEIFVDKTATDEVFKYWGKTTYLGHEGWITMKYLKKEYSDDIVTPENYTDSETSANVTNQNGETTISGTIGTPSSKYAAGDYKVSADGSSLRFKKEPGRNAEVLASIPDGTAVAVLEVVEIDETDDVYRYWGKVSYNGYTGYVSMAYLSK